MAPKTDRSETLQAHQQDEPLILPAPPVWWGGGARTVLVRKGSLRRAKNRRALAPSAPFWPHEDATGGSGGMSEESGDSRRARAA